ncbi:MAG: 1-acyl-sn-glycerol-3-phosphate acyltransferase, partial [Planctomycetaceae bacterium]
MDPTRFRRPPKWWAPKLCPLCVRLWRPFRRRYQRRVQRLMEIEVRGLDHLRRALAEGKGVLITPNHSAHADALVLLEAAHELGTPFYFMTAWQVIGMAWWGRRMVLRQHGCFS